MLLMGKLLESMALSWGFNMAIQKNIIDVHGATHTAAYTRVESVFFMSGEYANIDIRIYHNAAARSKDDATAEKPPFYLHTLIVKDSAFTTFFVGTVLDDADKSPFTQAYAYLKTQSTPINFTTGTSDV